MNTSKCRPDADLLPTALAGSIGMAVAMGFGRFSYTPILPGMMADLGLSASDAGIIASANFIGYLVGAVLAGYGWAAGRERRLGLMALAATAVLLLAMGLVYSVALLSLIRFFAGLASAFAMIFLSGIVLGRALRAGNPHVQSIHFGGVGIGIAVSSLMVWILAQSNLDFASSWRIDWFGGALIAFAGLCAVAMLLPKADASVSRSVPEKPLVWTRPLIAMTLTYGMFGFGYVITATFLVTMARQGAADQTIEFLAWLLTGLSAAVSVVLWRLAVPRFGAVGVYLIGLLVEAAGLIATVCLPLPYAPLIGGVLLGLTFIMITAYGLQIARGLAPESPRKALAFMTAAFGVGQILGPVVAGWIAERSGSFTIPTLLAAAVLLICTLITGIEMKRILAALDRPVHG